MNTIKSEDSTNAELSPRILFVLQTNNLTTSDKILLTRDRVYKQFGLSPEDIKAIRLHYSKLVCPPFVTALHCTTKFPLKWKRIAFGCLALDELTKNGIPTHGITEIYGEAGVGKSQICLQLSLTVQLSETIGGLDRGAVFICTEDAFPSKRLNEISDWFYCRYPKHTKNVQFLDNIFIEHPSDYDAFYECLSIRLPQLMLQQNIGLIVIDSVAAIFRPHKNAITRANEMRTIAKILLKLSDEHGCAILCVNQVASVIGEPNTLIPTLGLAWSNLVNTRIKIHRSNKFSTYKTNSDETRTVVREMEVQTSSELMGNRAEFIITPYGLDDLPVKS